MPRLAPALPYGLPRGDSRRPRRLFWSFVGWRFRGSGAAEAFDRLVIQIRTRRDTISPHEERSP
jgi:hypothetical protein